MEKVILVSLVMGLAGSLHCVGMCGPLISAMPYDRSSRLKFLRTKAMNHLGRISTYVVLGLMVGLAGQGFAAAGFQQGLSIASGLIILAFLFWPKRLNSFTPKGKIIAGVSKLKRTFSRLLENRNPGNLYLLGVLNGLLPCGLVYFALAGALATGSSVHGGIFMFFFGLGTTPALVAVGAFAAGIKQRFARQFQGTLRVLLVLMALLLIARGSNLGIPYVSPSINSTTSEMDCCHPRT